MTASYWLFWPQVNAPPQASSSPTRPEAGAGAIETRGERRRRETRDRLLDAALQLMAERSVEGVTIGEIAAAADIAVGSFYNHFQSKEDIHATLVDVVFETFADALDEQIGQSTDPAEVIGISVYLTLSRAKADPLWGQFLAREGFSPQFISGRGLGYRLYRDLQRGIASGRFRPADPFMSFLAVGSTVVGTLVAEVALDRASSELRKLSETDSASLPRRAVILVLQMLGLDAAEATALADKLSEAPHPARPVLKSK